VRPERSHAACGIGRDTNEARCCGAGTGLRVLDLDTPWKGVEAVNGGQTMNGMFPHRPRLVVDHRWTDELMMCSKPGGSIGAKDP
jgi:hypothetical protein